MPKIEAYIAQRKPDGTFSPLRPIVPTQEAPPEPVQASDIFPALAKAIAAAYRRDEERRRLAQEVP